MRSPDAMLMRRFVEARDAGDRAGMKHWWGEILTVNFDRITTMVRTEHKGRLSAIEEEEAVQRAAMNVATKRMDDFRGSSMGEWVELVRQVVRGACIDTQRREQRHNQHRAELTELDDEGQEFENTDLGRKLQREHDEAELAQEAEQALAQMGQDFLDWALPLLSDSHRDMIECDREGLPIEEIMERLGRKRDAVYKLRERAMKALGDLRSQYEKRQEDES